MQTEWVRDYIHKLFNTDIGKEGIEIRNSKLNYINLPLYKYCYICDSDSRNKSTVDYHIDNFEKDILFFQNPNKFNDPFDCFLGFSQSQIIRNLLTDELRQKKNLTPENRKAINTLFSDHDTPIDLQSISIDIIKQLVESLFDVMPDNDSIKLINREILRMIFDQSDAMIRRLISNKMTVLDKQYLIDLIYSNPTLQEHIKHTCTPENFDFILKAAPNDIKIDIENKPDRIVNNNSGELFGIFDFLKMICQAAENNNLSSDELDIIKQKINEISKEFLEKSRKLISEQFRITCLSERMDSPLMWSHYANKHYGFCLEYDFTLTITEKLYPDLLSAQLMLFPVNYSKTRPLLSNALLGSRAAIQYIKSKKLPPDFLEKLMYGLLFKSEEWAYEREWRIFQLPSETPTMRLPKARKVFLGANMEDTAKSRILQISEKKHIPVYQMFLRSDKYQFDYYQVK